jgi:hypothetical protein
MSNVVPLRKKQQTISELLDELRERFDEKALSCIVFVFPKYGAYVARELLRR